MKYYYQAVLPGYEADFKEYVHDINLYRFNWHQEIELTLILKGRAEFSIEGDTYELEEDDIILVNSNCGHASLARDPGSISLVLRFNPSVFSSADDKAGTMLFTCMSSQINRYEERFCRLRHYMAEMILAFCSDRAFVEQAVQGAFLMLTSSLIKDFPYRHDERLVSKARLANLKTVKRILDYMEKNFARKITLLEIANLTQYNRTYVSSFFKDNVGINFYEYLTRIRLRHALYELNSTDKSITEIAEQNGFPDLKAFNASFRHYFYKLPSQYRSQKISETAPFQYVNQRNYMDPGEKEIQAKLRSYQNISFLPSDCDSLTKEDREKNKTDWSDWGEELEKMGQRLGEIADELKYKEKSREHKACDGGQ